MKIAPLVVIVLMLAGCARDAPPAASPQPLSPAPDGSGPALTFETLADGFDAPLLLTNDGSASYVVEQGGKVWKLANGTRELWLDLSNQTQADGERGLLGLAFDPRDHRAYVDFTDLNGDSNIDRVLQNGSLEQLLFVKQPYANHNGGGMAFGPDGFLYIGFGDGGSGGDPEGNGQNKDALLASIVKIDPRDGSHAIFAKGLRNPWRFSFDRATGDLYIGDVGQDKWEEVDFLPRSAPAGANFGWNIYEGTHRYAATGAPFSDVTMPVAEYSHDDGCSITGGYVYRGAAQPALQGIYLFGDYCSGKIWGMREKNGAWNVVELADTELSISSFGEDASGEVYVVDQHGAVDHVVAGEIPTALR